MTKGYLDALENMKNGTDDWYRSYEMHEDYPVVKSALERLEQIDNSKSSKALESLENIKNFEGSYGTLYDSHREELDTIKQYILNAQELKSVLEKYNIESIEELEKILKS